MMVSIRRPWSVAILLAGVLLLPQPGVDAKKEAGKKAAGKGAAKKAGKGARAGKKAEGTKADKKAEGKSGGRRERLGLPRGHGRWRRHAKLRELARGFKLSFKDAERAFAQATVSRARAIAAQPASKLEKISIATLARVLFVLEVEGGGGGFRQKVAGLTRERRGEKVRVGDDVIAQFEFYEDLYRLPCRGKLTRKNDRWPPRYECSDKASPPTPEPAPIVKLGRAPEVIDPPEEADRKRKDPKTDHGLASKRHRQIAERDKFAMPHEKLPSPPREFCAQGRCHRSYGAVAAAIYGGRGTQNLPVFCAPKKSAAGKWDESRVECSANWLDTVGWKPWNREGEPNPPPVEADIPPFACVGSPHLFEKHMTLPAGGEAGKGFRCRRRVFRILAVKAEKSVADQRRNIALMCSELRGQVWGEKYPDINKTYQAWCNKNAALRKKGFCLPPGESVGGPESVPLPFMRLSREELLFFYGHRELYCRADRKGLLHFLDPEHKGRWAETFTCGVPRGLLEAGPFEEGVQACAIAPFAGREPHGSGVSEEDLKARLHCWKFDRPTCEQISDPENQDKKDSIHKSNVFDAYDALREARRTHEKKAWALLDLKDAEKLRDWEDRFAFGDGARDEGLFGVRSFCRFVGRRKHIQCGFDKKTMAQWYELHRHEAPEGCDKGICQRGAYRRGYYCGLFASREYFDGKPTWICGVDIGAAGRKILRDARAICVGGARAKDFQSPHGDRGSLQCYERRFRWGESPASEGILQGFSFAELVAKAAKLRPEFEPWLAGGDEAREWAREKADDAGRKRIKASFKHAQEVVEREAERDERELVRWAKRHGHTLGHRTSLRLGLIHWKGKSAVDVIQKFKKLKFETKGQMEYHPLGECPNGKKKDQCLTYKFEGDKNEKVRDKEKVKALNELIEEVATGKRAPDDRWYQDFRLEATEGGQLRVSPEKLAVVLRVHHLFEVLEAARKMLLRVAEKYADVVIKTARKREPLSRPELHERARDAAIPWRFKGNVFCVPDLESKGSPLGRKEFVCASSPLLVAGNVENAVDRRLGERGKKERRRQKARVKVKFDWCYGATRGKPLFSPRPTRAISETDLGSPFELEVPQSVLKAPKSKGKKRRRSELPRPRELQRLGNAGRVEDAFGLEQLLSSPAKKGSAKKASKGGGKKGKGEGKKEKAEGRSKEDKTRFYRKITDRMKLKSESNWLKCSKFQYHDELWEAADPKRDKKAKKDAARAKGAGGGGGDGQSKILQKVGGLLGSLVKFVLPKFADALERVQDLAHASGDFVDKWLDRLVKLGEKVWQKAAQVIEQAKDAVEKARNAVESATDPNAKATAKKAWEEAKKVLREKVSEVNQQTSIPGSGDLVSPMVEELLKLITGRVMETVEPGARNLLSQGFKFVRSLLDPIAQSVISAVAGIPFVGAALAAAAQVAYSMAMNLLEDAAFNALKGVVERILAKVLRPVVTPVFKFVQGKLLKLALSACATVFRDACPAKGFKSFAALPPRDRWLERALACPGRPIIDDRVRSEAVAARWQLLSATADMRREVAVYARDIADRYLARYGYTYDSWMAAVGRDARPVLVARATAIARDLGRRVDEMRRASLHSDRVR